MPFARVNDIDLFYEIHGNGSPIVFLSGFTSHHLGWTPFIEPFKNDFKLILLDNRGAGQSSAPPPPYTMEQFASDTVALMDHLNIEKADMVGSSMGTAIIQTIAHQYPARINKAALIAPFAKLPIASILKSEATKKLLAANVPIKLIIEAVIPWFYSNEFLSSEERVAAKIKEMAANPYPQSSHGYAGQLEALKQFDSSAVLSEITTEFLLLAGEQDLSTPLYCAQFLQDNLDNAKLHCFANVGHMLHAERTTDVIKLINGFFGK